MRKIKCLCCKNLFTPDKRNYSRQEYCKRPECRKESKKQSQKRWCNKSENKDYFSGAIHVERVRAWRRKNPHYWKRSRKPNPLQDSVNSHPTANQQDTNSNAFALQDFMNTQHALLLGVISQFTGHVLQDDIVPFMQKMIQKGRQILETKSA